MLTQKEQILELKVMREEKELTIHNICELIEKSGKQLSKSCVAKIFQDGSENHSFRQDSIKIIKDAISDETSVANERIKTIREQHQKEIEYLKNSIADLENKIEHEKRKADERVERERKHAESEREQFNLRIQQLNDHIKFLAGQINIKDGRMDQKDKRYDRLFERFDKKEEGFDKLIEQFLNRCENCSIKK
jgi:predicted phage tail protein